MYRHHSLNIQRKKARDRRERELFDLSSKNKKHDSVAMKFYAQDSRWCIEGKEASGWKRRPSKALSLAGCRGRCPLLATVERSSALLTGYMVTRLYINGKRDFDIPWLDT